MLIVHHVARRQMHELFGAAARPTVRDGQLVWKAPGWWHVMYDAIGGPHVWSTTP